MGKEGGFMPGERLMPEGTGGPDTGEPTVTPPVEIPGSSPEHKKSYQPPTPEEQARLEEAFGARNRAERTERIVASPQQISPELELQLRNLTENTNLFNFFGLSENDPDFQDKLKAIPQEVWNAAVNTKRAREGKGSIKQLPSDVSGIGQISQERARELELENERLREDAINLQNQGREGGVGIVTKENWMEAERYDHAPAYNKDYLSVRILDQMGRHMWVYWPKDEQEATVRVRDVVGRIELAREDVDPQLSLEYQRIQAILGAIKASKVLEQGFNLEHKLVRIEDGNQVKKIQEFNERLRTEFKGRRTFHQAFFTYETQSSIESVVKAAVTLGPKDFNALFTMSERAKGSDNVAPGIIYNPFIEALQFYEDHGHEFARHNSEEDRPKFGEKVMQDLQLRFGGQVEDYAWAQNLAERYFRFSGRAEEYDYLVYEKDTENEQIVKFLDPGVHPITGKKEDMKDWNIKKGKPITEKIPVSWASGRDGCDYDITKIIHSRGFYRAEGGLRAYPGLLNGVDTFGGDFIGRTIVGSFSTTNFISGEKGALSFRVSKEKLEEKIKEIMVKDKLTREQAERLLYVVDEPDLTSIVDQKDRQKVKGYYDAAIFMDRESNDNKGERVGRINFRLMGRMSTEEGKIEEPVLDGKGKVIKGFNFDSMGSTPLGLWVTRYVNGPEALRNALAGKAESFLSNPNTETYRALIDAFGFQKIPSHENLRQLAINLIDFSKNERKEKTGRPNLNRTEIMAMVNDLSGLTDPNKPAVFNMEDRKEVLQKALGRYWRLINIAITVKDGIIGFILGVLGHILKQGFSDVGK